MKLENKRIYISNLPPTITQEDLEQKFSEYGSVSSVEIKNRKNVTSEVPQQFAYVTLTVSKHDLSNCFDEFGNRKWRGHWVTVQEAKESFMDRLKREREAGSDLNAATNTEVSTPTRIQQPSSSYINRNTTKPSKVYHSSSSDEEPTPKTVVINNHESSKLKRKYPKQTHNNNHSSYFSNETQNNNNNGNLDSKKEVVVKEKESVQTSEADQKRLQSIIRMRKNYQQQKQVLKNALSNIDSKPKNKIIFDDENGEIETPLAKKIKSSDIQQTKNSLFDEEDENEHNEYNFEIKEQFEGKKGQKLLQLQSRFKNDKRFTMDRRFLEDNEDEEIDIDNAETKPDSEMTIDDEKQKQFEILEQVLGKKVKRNNTLEKDKNSDRQNVKMMLRFDPSQPNHSKFEIKEEKKKKPSKGLEDNTKIAAVEEVPKPEVSKETFYKVAMNFKDALQDENQGFSLANLFSKTIATVEKETQDDPVTTDDKLKNLYDHEPNPFRYDSSEEENDDTTTSMITTEKHVDTPTVQHIKVGPAKLWTESFFFKHDDYRLQEGLDFIKRLEVDEQTDFPKLRRNLHEIVKAKVRNNQRKNRPFRKKLGGKKRLRVKRALKR